MQLTIELTDEILDELATRLASKVQAGGAAAEEGDDFGEEAEPEPEPEPEITLTVMQDTIKEAVGKHGKDKIKALVKKIAGADKVADIKKEKYEAVLAALKKVK